MFPTIQNIVCTCNVGCTLFLDGLQKALIYGEYNPKRFAAVRSSPNVCFDSTVFLLLCFPILRSPFVYIIPEPLLCTLDPGKSSVPALEIQWRLVWL